MSCGRKHREGERHRFAYAQYRQLGDSRSLEKLRVLLRELWARVPSLTTLYNWSRWFRWQERLAEEAEAVRAETLRRNVDAVATMNDRQAQLGTALQTGGGRALQLALQNLEARLRGAEATPQPLGPRDIQGLLFAAARAIGDGARVERLARGEPTERVNIEVLQRILQTLEVAMDRAGIPAEVQAQFGEELEKIVRGFNPNPN